MQGSKGDTGPQGEKGDPGPRGEDATCDTAWISRLVEATNTASFQQADADRLVATPTFAPNVAAAVCPTASHSPIGDTASNAKDLAAHLTNWTDANLTNAVQAKCFLKDEGNSLKTSISNMEDLNPDRLRIAFPRPNRFAGENGDANTAFCLSKNDERYVVPGLGYWGAESKNGGICFEGTVQGRDRPFYHPPAGGSLTHI